MAQIPRVSDFVLASLLTSYPDFDFGENLKMLTEEGEASQSTAVKILADGVIGNEKRIDEIRSEYLALFDSGRGVAPLYETEYGRQRAMFKANELSAISGFYKAFGFELGGEDGAREMPDHISVELEFYALLLMKLEALQDLKDTKGIEIVEKARKKFLEDHLGRFVPAILCRPGVAQSNPYGMIFRFVDGLLRAECEAVGARPEVANWIEGEQETAEVACGAVAGCTK